MKVIEPFIKIEDDIDGYTMLKKIEKIGRVCYKSEERITDKSCVKFVRSILDRGHESVIEHVSISVRVICDRGVSHEIVRHRLASYSQESTRYCNYCNDKFGGELTFIKPCFWKAEDCEYKVWKESMRYAEKIYMKLIEIGAHPQEARSVLPNSIKTEIVMTMNLREWRHFFKLRTTKFAHPQMKEIADMILKEFKRNIPIVFDDIVLE